MLLRLGILLPPVLAILISLLVVPNAGAFVPPPVILPIVVPGDPDDPAPDYASNNEPNLNELERSSSSGSNSRLDGPCVSQGSAAIPDGRQARSNRLTEVLIWLFKQYWL
jgi:hypothetical protein